MADPEIRCDPRGQLRIAGLLGLECDFSPADTRHWRREGTALGVIAVYPGTFDPITLGHADIVSRAAPLFEKLILGVAGSTAKNTVFSADERVELASEILAGFTNVEVQRFDGLMVDFARKVGATVVLRGLRAVTDFEYEFQLAGMNRKLMPEADTVFLPTSEQHTYISSSLVREISALGGDISDFVHPRIKQVLDERRVSKNKGGA